MRLTAATSADGAAANDGIESRAQALRPATRFRTSIPYWILANPSKLRPLLPSTPPLLGVHRGLARPAATDCARVVTASRASAAVRPGRVVQDRRSGASRAQPLPNATGSLLQQILRGRRAGT